MEENYPDFPLNYRAGWGYLLKTYSLPNQDSGIFTLYAKAEDKEGNIVTLGSKSITVNKVNGVKPFGAIDILAEAVNDEGSNLINEGWTLIPQPNIIPINCEPSEPKFYTSWIWSSHSSVSWFSINW
jgi:hypothetical protein